MFLGIAIGFALGLSASAILFLALLRASDAEDVRRQEEKYGKASY